MQVGYEDEQNSPLVLDSTPYYMDRPPMVDAQVQTEEPTNREAITQTLIVDTIDEDTQTQTVSTFDEQVQVNILKVAQTAETST